MTTPPYMPLWIRDFLTDTTRLDLAETGAYLLLIMDYWTNGHPPPDDDRQLARICRTTPAAWRRIRPALEVFFKPGWRHNRVEAELAKAAEKYERRAAAGRAGGKAAALTRNETSNATSNASGIVTSNASGIVTSNASGIVTSNASGIVTSNASGNAVANGKHTEPETDSESVSKKERKYEETLQTKQRSNTEPRDSKTLDLLENALRSAAKVEESPAPGLLVLGPILGLLDGGYSLEEDILPVIRAKPASPNWRPSSWSYYVRAIEEARAKRNGVAANPVKPKLEPEVLWGRMLKAWDGGRGMWHQGWGPRPDSPGCRVPEAFQTAWATAQAEQNAKAQEDGNSLQH